MAIFRLARSGRRQICGTSTGTTYQKASWTTPSDVLKSVRDRVSRGPVSAYVTEALRRQLALDGLAGLVDELEAEGVRDQ